MAVLRNLFAGVAWIIAEFGFTADDILSLRKYARFAIQKVSYLLHYLGVDGFKDVSFNLYVNGPYSVDLADTYYELARRYPDSIEEFAKGFKLDDNTLALVKWFMKKRYWWMEIATTILMIYKRHSNIDFNTLYILLRSAKPWVDIRTAALIYRDLKRVGLIPK